MSASPSRRSILEKEASKLSAAVSFLIPTTKKDVRSFELEADVALQPRFRLLLRRIRCSGVAALDPVMEKEDLAVAHAAAPSGVVFGDWVDGQSLRGAEWEVISLDVDSKASPTAPGGRCLGLRQAIST